MSSLLQSFATIAGCIREKTKKDIKRPPITDILVKYGLSSDKPVLTAGKKKFSSILSL